MLMGTGIEYMREHIPSNARIHYIVSNGGMAPCGSGHRRAVSVRSQSLARYAGWNLGTYREGGAGRSTDDRDDHGCEDRRQRQQHRGERSPGQAAQKNLEEVGGFRYDAAEQHFAGEMQKSLAPGGARDTVLAEKVEPLRPFDPNEPAASTDVGDVSWNVPTIGFTAATFAPGIVPHTWQAAACAGMSIGQKAMLVAAKSMAILGGDLFMNPQLVRDAKADFARQMKGRTYKSEIPEGQKPPLDYRM